jgi:putative endonuclease
MASRRNGTLYVGVTSDLLARVWQHKNGAAEGFSRRYRTHILVWYEMHSDIQEAIAREKRIKRWNRAWKISLIEAENSGWNDLSARLGG